MKFLDVGGERFHVALDGPEGAPALMLSNSLASNLAMWDAQVPALAKHFRVVRYDSRGHGQSPAPDRPYSIAELGRDALAIMQALNIAKAHWCGLSKGGMVGQWLAANAPERLDRVILANTSSRMGPPDIWNARIAATRKDGMAAIADTTIERWFTAGFRKRAADTVATIRAMILATPPQGYAACCAAIRDMDQREAVRGVKKPVMVIIGKEDPATTPEMGDLLAGSIPGAKSVKLDAAHLSNVEQPEAFSKAVVDFLKG